MNQLLSILGRRGRASIVVFALVAVSLGMPTHALAAPAEAPLDFRMTEGSVINAFHRDGPVAAHLLLSSGDKPRVLAAFPAGNSSVGVWFEDADTPVNWTLGDLHSLTRKDAEGRPLHGITTDATVDASRLVVRDAVLGSVRVLRDYQLGIAYPPVTKATPRVSAKSVSWERARIDGAPGYAISLELLNGQVRGGSGAPLVLSPTKAGEPLRLRITALTGETPLTPLTEAKLFDAGAGTDVRSRQVLQFLAYEEKYLAGSWRFDTYFGRDTLMSVRMLMPSLQPLAIEDGLASVLERLNADGEAAHEEDIGEFALLRHRKENGPDAPYSDVPVYDYGMIDDDFMLAPVAAAYLLDHAASRDRVAAFLARRTTAGDTLGAALARNFAFVTRSAQAFATQTVATNLIALKPGRKTGEWRDSEDGLADGHYPYDVNAVFVPAALDAIARIEKTGLLTSYVNAEQHRQFAQADTLARTWATKAPPLFDVALDETVSKRAITAYATSQKIDATAALASVPRNGLHFAAIALDADGKAIPVLNSDPGFALLFQDPPAKAVDGMVDALLRPFPAGLLTDIGLLVANPAFVDAGLQKRFDRNAYHGTVVWSWQQALLAAGLQRQVTRSDLPDTTRAHLRDAQQRLWRAIDATNAMRTSELCSWSYADGRYRVEPFGQSKGDADESNAAQLWSTVYLAIPRPE